MCGSLRMRIKGCVCNMQLCMCEYAFVFKYACVNMPVRVQVCLCVNVFACMRMHVYECKYACVSFRVRVLC